MSTLLQKTSDSNPVDIAISHIRELISSETIRLGEKLPPERKIAETLGISRSYVRDAIHQLRIYGILKVQPQSGTYVTGTGVIAIESLTSELLKMDHIDFKSLVETRILLETESARLAAERHTDLDITNIRAALESFEIALNAGEASVGEDLFFHIRIAEASKNPVLKSLMMTITPDLIKSYRKYNICSDDSDNQKLIKEHRDLVAMIEDKDGEGAKAAMIIHLKEIKKFSLNFNL